MEFLRGLLENIRKQTTLVHHLTNYVTVNDCANIALACGGSPIMGDEIDEVEQIVSQCHSLVINIGTANSRTVASMIQAGRCANNLDLPILLDPVGAGASIFRKNAVASLLQEVNFTVIKGNISEMRTLAGEMMSTCGVDASQADLVNESNLYSEGIFARKLSVLTGAVIVITGPIDIVTDSSQIFAIRNGHLQMSNVTGTGCMLGTLIGCFIGANPGHPMEASVAATALMGVCGELAYEKMIQIDAGLNTFRSLLIDAVGKMDGQQLISRAKIESF